MKFEPGVFCKNIDRRAIWFLFKKDKVLYYGSMEKCDVCFPELLSPSELGLKTSQPQFIGTLDGKGVFAASVLDCEEICYNCCGVATHTYANPRDLFPIVGEEIFCVICRALHIVRWHENWKFCPRCGAKVEDSKTERALVCPECGRTDYPLLAPAVIVAVTKGDKILLAHNTRFADKDRFSVLAGFVESGESSEDAIRREIREEVGIEVKEIKYFGSQCWPFPYSFMIAFTAEYASGVVKPDGVELDRAGWFDAKSLPSIPQFGSISRALIEDFKKNHPIK